MNNEEFDHSQLEAHFLYPNSFAEIMIKHLQPYLPCPSNSQFKSGIKKAFGPNKSIWSSDSLYLWSGKSCYDL